MYAFACDTLMRPHESPCGCRQCFIQSVHALYKLGIVDEEYVKLCGYENEKSKAAPVEKEQEQSK